MQFDYMIGRETLFEGPEIRRTSKWSVTAHLEPDTGVSDILSMGNDSFINLGVFEEFEDAVAAARDHRTEVTKK